VHQTAPHAADTGVTPMKAMLCAVLCAVALPLTLAGARPALAYYCEDGQQPAPPEVAAQMALPLCGFAATKRWGANGCQLCDPRNMHPNPYNYPSTYYDQDRKGRHPHAYRADQ
jgi:hypothetical protein